MSTEIPPVGRDAGAGSKLQILATEHWSLLATRTLTYNEALSRVTIFVAILSGALIALALVAQADHFGAIFISIAIPCSRSSCSPASSPSGARAVLRLQSI
jgi:hypothetical protein